MIKRHWICRYDYLPPRTSSISVIQSWDTASKEGGQNDWSVCTTWLRQEGNYAAAFRTGLGRIGYVDGQNASIEYHWLERQYDRFPASVAEWVRRRVAVIAVPGNTATALAAKAATSTIPIVFGVGDDPVRLVWSRARRGRAGATHRSKMVCDLPRAPDWVVGAH
jgi:hypothetical protein